MFSRRQIVQVELDHHALLPLPHGVIHEGGTNILALSVFEFNAHLGSAWQ